MRGRKRHRKKRMSNIVKHVQAHGGYIDWGDGTIERIQPGELIDELVHEYKIAGIYNVEIYGEWTS